MDENEREKPSKSARELMEAKVRVDRAVERYTQAQRLQQDAQVQAEETLHNAVIGWFWRMRPHIRGKDGWDKLSDLDEIDDDTVFSGVHPQTETELTIRGLSELGEWVDKTATVAQQNHGPLSSRSATRQTITLRLPPSAALTAAEAMTVHFNKSGWTAKPEDTTHLDEPDGSDLEGLLLARGQTKAASQLPERFKGNKNNGGDDD